METFTTNSARVKCQNMIPISSTINLILELVLLIWLFLYLDDNTISPVKMVYNTSKVCFKNLLLPLVLKSAFTHYLILILMILNKALVRRMYLC